MFCRQPSLFDAEIGEGSFSVLSRAAITDTMKTSLDHLSNLFTLATPYLRANRVFNDFAVDFSNKDQNGKKRSGCMMSAGDEDVQQMASFLDNVVNELRQNQYGPYLDTRAYVSKTVAQLHRVNPTENIVFGRRFQKSSTTLLEAALTRSSDFCNCDWANRTRPILDAWPDIPRRSFAPPPSNIALNTEEKVDAVVILEDDLQPQLVEVNKPAAVDFRPRAMPKSLDDLPLRQKKRRKERMARKTVCQNKKNKKKHRRNVRGPSRSSLS
jgi:hypothetical protein